MSNFQSDPERELRFDAPSAERRRLLRAAAAAPLVASLPSGMVYAMASASQCVIDSKRESDIGVPILSQAAQDKWVRRKVTSQIFGTFQGGNQVSKQLWLIDGNWYGEDGNIETGVNTEFPPNTCDLNTTFCAVSPPQDAFVLQVFTPDYSATGDPNFPNSVNPEGIYPPTSIAFFRPSSPPENMGITGTCLCSVDPNFAPPGYCA